MQMRRIYGESRSIAHTRLSRTVKMSHRILFHRIFVKRGVIRNALSILAKTR